MGKMVSHLCAGTNKSGKPCKKAIKDEEQMYCHVHSDQAAVQQPTDPLDLLQTASETTDESPCAHSTELPPALSIPSQSHHSRSPSPASSGTSVATAVNVVELPLQVSTAQLDPEPAEGAHARCWALSHVTAGLVRPARCWNVSV